MFLQVEQNRQATKPERMIDVSPRSLADVTKQEFPDDKVQQGYRTTLFKEELCSLATLSIPPLFLVVHRTVTT